MTHTFDIEFGFIKRTVQLIMKKKLLAEENSVVKYPYYSPKFTGKW